ncbi:MAG: TetR/AcrR family transcriptional regulator [Proteobacteria bacterium]|nr:TetR/AcrR family transcriptional regulator [Pseudomonadota bacterium]
MEIKTKSTKEKLDSMAMSLFINKGIEGTSIRDIVFGIGLTEGAFYRHYKSKDELIKNLFLKSYLDLSGKITAILRKNHSFEKKLSTLIKFLCESIDNDPVLFQYLLVTQHNLLTLVPADAKTPFIVVKEFFQQSIDEKSCKIQDATFCATIFLGIIVQSLISRKYKRSDKKMMEDYENILNVIKDSMVNN